MSPGELRLRRARPGDLAALIALEAASFAAVDRFPRRSWRRLLAVPTAVVVVAQAPTLGLHGAICALLRANATVARIYSLAVHPDARGQGLGQRLVLGLDRHLPKRIATLSLEVRCTNAAALGLYQRLGFAPAGPLPAYYADGGDGMRLRAKRSVPAHPHVSNNR